MTKEYGAQGPVASTRTPSSPSAACVTSARNSSQHSAAKVRVIDDVLAGGAVGEKTLLYAVPDTVGGVLAARGLHPLGGLLSRLVHGVANTLLLLAGIRRSCRGRGPLSRKSKSSPIWWATLNSEVRNASSWSTITRNDTLRKSETSQLGRFQLPGEGAQCFDDTRRQRLLPCLYLLGDQLTSRSDASG